MLSYRARPGLVRPPSPQSWGRLSFGLAEQIREICEIRGCNVRGCQIRGCNDCWSATLDQDAARFGGENWTALLAQWLGEQVCTGEPSRADGYNGLAAAKALEVADRVMARKYRTCPREMIQIIRKFCRNAYQGDRYISPPITQKGIVHIQGSRYLFLVAVSLIEIPIWFHQHFLRLRSKPIIRELLRNSAFFSSGQIYQLGLSALLNIILARRLGPELIGIYIATQSMIGLVMVFANLGIEVPFKREASRNQAQFPQYFGSALAIRLTISAPITLIVSLIAGIFLGIALVPIITVMTLLMVFIALGALTKAAFQALNHFDVAAKLTAFSQTIYVGVVVLVLWLWSDLIIVLAAMAVLQAGFLLMNLVVLWRMQYHFRLLWDFHLWKRMIKEALPVMLANSGEYANLRSDSIIIAAVLGSVLAGIYGIAYNFYLMIVVIVYLPSVSAFPTLARYSAAHNLKDYRKFVNKLGVAIAGYALVAAVVLFFVAPFLLPLLYGQEYADSLSPLRVLIFALPFVALNRLMVQSLNASGLQRWTFFATAFGAIFNISVNLVLIPRFGIMAAAVTTLATEILVWLVAFWGLYKSAGYV